MNPRDISTISARLRAGSIDQLAGLSDDELESTVLPGWTAADVYRHLIASDRGSVLGTGLLGFLPSKDLDDLESANDDSVAALRHLGREEIRRDLEVWGKRLRLVIGAFPAPVTRLRVPISFGRLPLWWLATLRPYDEWIHQWDVATALGHEPPTMDIPTRHLLGRFLLEGVAGSTLPDLEAQGAVRIDVVDAREPAWTYDLARRRGGRDLDVTPDATVHVSTPSFCLAASDRLDWTDLEDLEVTGDDATAQSLLDAIHIV